MIYKNGKDYFSMKDSWVRNYYFNVGFGLMWGFASFTGCIILIGVIVRLVIGWLS